MKLFVISIIAFCFCACSQTPEPVSENFLNAYVEIRIVNDIYGERPDAGLLRRDILKKYNISAESFSAETNRILNDYHLWNDFQKSVLAKFDSLAKLQETNSKEQHQKEKSRPARTGKLGEN